LAYPRARESKVSAPRTDEHTRFFYQLACSSRVHDIYPFRLFFLWTAVFCISTQKRGSWILAERKVRNPCTNALRFPPAGPALQATACRECRPTNRAHTRTALLFVCFCIVLQLQPQRKDKWIMLEVDQVCGFRFFSVFLCFWLLNVV
jgi:hypothetical protein